MDGESSRFAKLSDERTADPELSVDEFVNKVIGKFSSKNRERINHEDIESVVAGLTLQEPWIDVRSPALRVLRVRFSGDKQLHDQDPEPFVYDQQFDTGVNVICIPDNEVGKSSILKTIKYGLTGDDGDYDSDVRSWIRAVHLAFALDKQEFTVLISGQGTESHGLLLPGRHFGPFDSVATETTLAIFDVRGSDAIREELKRFFFQRLGLSTLSWTQEDTSSDGKVAKRSTSWLTYFQALHLQDAGTRYLLLDPQHAFGNQEGLIFSAFLGLRLVEPLNHLGVEASLAKKTAKIDAHEASERAETASKLIGQLNEEISDYQRQVKDIENAQRARRRAVEEGEPAQRLIQVQSDLTLKGSEMVRLEAERDDLKDVAKRIRVRKGLMEEAKDLKLHFTGIEVSLCPNCDTAVTEEALEREKDSHVCRLCGTLAHAADEPQVAVLVEEIREIELALQTTIKSRDDITSNLGKLRGEIGVLKSDEALLRDAAMQGVSYALHTEEEQTQLNRLLEAIGGLRARITLAQPHANLRPAVEESEADIKVRILDKVRDVLADEANQRNGGLLHRLSTLVQEMTTRIGGDSITDVDCSPLGKVKLKKHGQTVTFGGIQNEGERLRVKLAFFLAMMWLGRDRGLGRHPGILLIDQPGSSEMVEEDAEQLASMFLEIDAELAGEMQIICCTARPEFLKATAPGKVYGAQAGRFAF